MANPRHHDHQAFIQSIARQHEKRLARKERVGQLWATAKRVLTGKDSPSPAKNQPSKTVEQSLTNHPYISSKRQASKSTYMDIAPPNPTPPNAYLLAKKQQSLDHQWISKKAKELAPYKTRN